MKRTKERMHKWANDRAKEWTIRRREKGEKGKKIREKTNGQTQYEYLQYKRSTHARLTGSVRVQ